LQLTNQRLGKFNAIMCAKYHNILTSPTNSSDITKLFSRNRKREEMFYRIAPVRIYQRPQSHGWTQILNTTFGWKTGHLIY